MDNFIIVTLFVGSVVYKIYTNYKKEMETAAKRIPSARPTPPPVAPKERNHTLTTQKTDPIKKGMTPPVPSAPAQEYVPSEVLQARQGKKETALKEKYLALKEEKVPEENNIEFDLRQAVIQSIILERPYK